MCLRLNKNSKELVANVDIICYKFIEKGITEINFVTPYRNFIIEIGKTYTSDLIVENSKVEIGIHSFKKYKDCVVEAKYWIRENRDEIIVKCIIPKGSKYYKGKYYNTISYVSSAIIYKEIKYVFDYLTIEKNVI